MKSVRQKEILSIIKDRVILTQEDLQNELMALGYEVTQSTVSRDIKELKLVKSHDALGNYRYTANENSNATHTQSHYRDVFAKAVKRVDYALNNVVVKCYSGMASGACVAIDEMFHNLMLGSLAGDDTIIIVTKSEADSKILFDELNNIL